MSATEPEHVTDAGRAHVERILGPHADSSAVEHAIERLHGDATLAAVWRWATAPFDPTTLVRDERRAP